MEKRTLTKTTDGQESLLLDKSTNTVYKHRTQDTNPYYEFNALMRDNIGKEAVTRRWALPVANIPLVVYQNMLQSNPDLSNPDAKVRTAAWLKVLKTPELEQLRTVRKNLIPDHAEPDYGSIILPYKEKASGHTVS